MSRNHTHPAKDQNYQVSITPGQRSLITRYGSAMIDWAFVGSQPPEDHDEIEELANVARYNLEAHINGLNEKIRKLEEKLK